MTSPPPRSRRRWLRFSLRTLLLFSILAGALALLWSKRAAWRLDYVMDISKIEGPGRSYKVGAAQLTEIDGRHYVFYRNDVPNYTFDFFETYNQDAPYFHIPNHVSITHRFSPDLSKLLVSDACHACLYDIPGRRMLHEWSLLPADGRNVPQNFLPPVLAFSRDGNRIAIFTYPNRVAILDARSGRLERTLESAHNTLYAMHFSPDSKSLLITSATTYGFDIANLETGAIVPVPTVVKDIDHSQCAWLEGAPRTLVAHRISNAVVQLDTETGRPIQTFPHDPATTFDGFSSDGSRYYLSSSRSTSIVDARTGLALRNIGSVGKTISQGDLCLSNAAEGELEIRKLKSGWLAATLDLKKMTTLPPITHFQDVIADITCKVSTEPPMIQFASSVYSEESILIEGPRPFGNQVAGPTRDYILRRNHPEEWWGLACLPEFWLAAVIFVAFVWSLIRDWRELPRGAGVSPARF